MRETTKHREAFDCYWQLGAERTIERLHAQLQQLARSASRRAPSMRTLFEWSRILKWQRRIAELETEARRAGDRARREALDEMYARQVREALLLQQRGAEWLTAELDEQPPASAAIRAIVDGAKLERLARGEPSERLATEDDDDHERFAELSDHELRALAEAAALAVDRAHETGSR